MAVLKPQLTPAIEVIVNVDGGEKSIGQKRNELVQSAVGIYTSMVDDDDLISDNYCSLILSAIQPDECGITPDCIGMEGVITFDGWRPQKFIHSLQYTDWFEKDHVFYRSCNHLNPIKTEFVKQVLFPEINHGEDKEFSMKIAPLLKTEVYINEPIYYYEFRSNKNTTPRINKIDRRRNSKQV